MLDILTSSSGQRILFRCPPYYANSRVFNAYLQTIGAEFDNYHAWKEQILMAFFATDDMPEWALVIWEEELNLGDISVEYYFMDSWTDLDALKLSWDELDALSAIWDRYSRGGTFADRLSRIQAKLLGYGTVDAALIKATALKYDKGEVDVSVAGYTVSITFLDVTGIPANLDSFKEVLESIIPAHLITEYIYNYFLWSEMDDKGWSFDQLDALGITWDELEVYS